jgi:plasmid stabilization system protein ParE
MKLAEGSWPRSAASLRRRAGAHMIYFRETDYGIAVIRILHTRMNPIRPFQTSL